MLRLMRTDHEVELRRDTSAAIIPAGDVHVLKAGTKVVISQALGGSVTVRSQSGLFRIAGPDLDALGDAAALAHDPASVAGTDVGSSGAISEAQVWEAMKNCYDPEIPVNVVDLGLIYDLQMQAPEAAGGGRSVQVKMTLTAQGCGMGPVIAEDLKQHIEALPAVAQAQVEIVWDPPWTPHMISSEGRQKLGID